MANYESSVLKIGEDYITLADKKAREDIAQLQGKIDNLPSGGGEVSPELQANVVCFKQGDAYQMRTKLNEYIFLTSIYQHFSANGGMDFKVSYKCKGDMLSDKWLTDGVWEWGQYYKSMLDDIAPIHYNNEYRGAGHGILGRYNITATRHGLTEADIGSQWLSANGIKEIIVCIIDENTFAVVSDYTGNLRSPMTRTAPTSPLTHISGATHTGNIAFTGTKAEQLVPMCNNYDFYIRTDSGTIIRESDPDGIIKADKYIDVVESYKIIDFVAMLNHLKANVGSNKNDTYHSDEMAGDILYQTTYRYFPSSCCFVSVTLTPLKEGVQVDYFGGIQAVPNGPLVFVPHTKNYGTVTEHASGAAAINFNAETWEDETFPPYKFYEFSKDYPENGFVLGYCIDHGQAKPEVRATNVSGGTACDISPPNKIYPYFYNNSAKHPDLYGKSLSVLAFRAPVLIKGNKTLTWYTVGNDTYIEAEFLEAFSGMLELPDICDSKRVEVIKSTETVSVLSDVVSSNGVFCVASGTGSVTLKCY